GVALAGSTDDCARILQAHVRQIGGREEVTLLGTGLSASVPKAALANGVAGHAMDYDDTQLSTSKEAVYGLLTHPTTPVLAAVFWYDDQAAPCRTGGRERRDRRLVGAGRIHCGPQYFGGAQRFLQCHGWRIRPE